MKSNAITRLFNGLDCIPDNLRFGNLKWPSQNIATQHRCMICRLILKPIVTKKAALNLRKIISTKTADAFCIKRTRFSMDIFANSFVIGGSFTNSDVIEQYHDSTGLMSQLTTCKDFLN